MVPKILHCRSTTLNPISYLLESKTRYRMSWIYSFLIALSAIS